MRKPTILFVCKGNTCRSPMAELIVKQKIGTVFNAESAGISAKDGSPLSKNAKKILKRFKYSVKEIKAFRSKHISELTNVYSYTFVVAMDKDVYVYLKETYHNLRVRSWNIKDPFGKDLWVYKKTAQKIIQKLTR